MSSPGRAPTTEGGSARPRDGTVRPLHGVKVLDLSRVFAGPIAGRTLSDLGADVVKVEPPDGDITRLWGRKTAGLSTYFTQQNCGKRNVCIDLHADGGPELVARLAEQADVLIENFRPGVMAKFGLDWEALSARNATLIMLSISGFGQEGPESQRAAYASIVHAEAGILPVGVGDEMPLDLDLSAADVLSGMHGVIAVLTALRTRDVGGTGQHIDMAMIDAMTYSADIIVNVLDGARRTEAINGEVWRTVDGPKMLTGGLRWIWHQLSTTAGLVDPTPSDADISDKIAARRRIIVEHLCDLPDRAAVIATFDAANLAWADVRDCAEVLESPTLIHRGTVVDVDDRAGGTRKVVRNPYRMSGIDFSDIGVAAFRGEHNAEVLDEWLDITTDGVAALAQDEWVDSARLISGQEQPMDDALLQRLVDESDLRDLLHRYAFGLDHRDWELWRSVFTDSVTMDMSDYQPDPPPQPAPADRVVANARALFTGLERSQHFMGSHRYAIDGDRATITAHMRAEHWLHTGRGGDKYTMFGTYTDEAVRTAGGWKIERVRLRLLREEGNRNLMREAVRRGRQALT